MTLSTEDVFRISQPYSKRVKTRSALHTYWFTIFQHTIHKTPGHHSTLLLPKSLHIPPPPLQSPRPIATIPLTNLPTTHQLAQSIAMPPTYVFAVREMLFKIETDDIFFFFRRFRAEFSASRKPCKIWSSMAGRSGSAYGNVMIDRMAPICATGSSGAPELNAIVVRQRESSSMYIHKKCSPILKRQHCSQLIISSLVLDVRSAVEATSLGMACDIHINQDSLVFGTACTAPKRVSLLSFLRIGNKFSWAAHSCQLVAHLFLKAQPSPPPQSATRRHHPDPHNKSQALDTRLGNV